MRIDPVVVVAELRHRIVAFVAIVDDQTGIVADHMDLAVFDRGKAVGNDRQTGDAERHGAQDIAIVQRHLQAFIEILVVHVVDAVHRMHVGAREPLHQMIELCEHIVVFEHVARHRRTGGGDLCTRYLVAAAVDGVEQRLRQIDAGAEELHLLAEPHRRDAARDAVVVAPMRPHQIVVFILQRRRVAADLDAIALEILRQML